MRQVLLASLIAATLTCASCSERVTRAQVIVELDADEDIKAEMAKLEIQVEGGDGLDALGRSTPQHLEPAGDVQFPTRIALHPRQGMADRRVFSLTATAFDADSRLLGQARIISGYVAGEVRYVRLRIEGAACLRLTCDALRATCAAGDCVDATVQAADLSRDGKRPTAASSVRDGTPLDVPAGRADVIVDLDAPCSEEGALACLGHDSTETAICAEGVWSRATPCPEMQRCDTRRGETEGQCLDVSPDCENRRAAEQFCRGNDRVTCGPDLLTSQVSSCPEGRVCMRDEETTGCVSDIDECAAQSDDCNDDPDACLNTFGGYECACPSGFDGDGRGSRGCVDRNECEDGAMAACGAGATRCANTPGGYSCTCAAGYEGTGTKACHEVNECLRGLIAACGTGAASCSNTDGGYSCACEDGYAADADGRGCHARAWRTPVLVESSNAAADRPAVAADSSGVFHTVWAQSDGTYKRIWWRRQLADGAWDEPLPLASRGYGDANAPVIAADPSGGLIVAWYEYDGLRNSIFASPYGVASGWDYATELTGVMPPGPSCCPHLTISDSGNALVLWQMLNGSQPETWGSYLPRGGSWSEGTVLFSNAAPSAAIERLDGSWVAVCTRNEESISLASNVFTPATGWSSTPVGRLERQVSNFGGYLALAPSGRVRMVWSRTLRPQLDVDELRVSELNEDGSWQTPATITVPSTTLRAGAMAIDARGTMLVLWEERDASAIQIWLSRQTAAGEWLQPIPVREIPIVDSPDYQLAFRGMQLEPNGDAHIFWTESDGTRFSLWSNHFVASAGAVSPAVAIETGTSNVERPVLAVNANGNALLVWEQSDGARTNIWASRFE